MLNDNEILILNTIKTLKNPVGAIYLSKELNISQATVGRILKKLEDFGYISKLSNKGRIITDKGNKFLDEHTKKSDKLNIAEKIINSVNTRNINEYLEVLNVRICLESYSSKLCAENISDDEILQLEKIHEEYINLINNHQDADHLDLLLHIKIAEFSKNNTLKHMLELLLTENSNYKTFSNASFSQNRLLAYEHEKILNAIKSHDKNTASKEMKLHLNRVIKDIINSI